MTDHLLLFAAFAVVNLSAVAFGPDAAPALLRRETRDDAAGAGRIEKGESAS